MPERRATIATALAIVVCVIGWRIPIPGIDLDQVMGWYGPSGSFPATLSIFALGVIPFFTILTYAEAAKLAFPPLARWQAGSTRKTRHVALIIAVLSLILAAWQGHQVLIAIGASDIVRLEAVGFVPTALATYIACTVLTIWLADWLRLPALGDGFWLLIAISFVAGLSDQAVALVDRLRMGAMSANQLLIVGLFLAVAIALAVFANLLLSRNGSASGAEKTSILLWPPYLASLVAGFAFVLFPTDMPGWPFVAPSFIEIANLALVVVLIPLLVFAYAHSFRLSRRDGQQLWSTPVLLTVTVIQIVLCFGAALLPTLWDLPFSLFGGEFLVMGTVMLALRNGLASTA